MFDSVAGTKIEAIATCVPKERETNEQLSEIFGDDAMRRFGKSTGILARRIARNCSALDLSIAAAERLRADGYSFDGLCAIIFVSQTPEYILPASAAIAQSRLGLPTHIAAFDVNLGCSGYVYGLLIAARLLAGRGRGRVLLLVGDTISKVCAEDDRATRPIFGDAGSATLIAAAPGAPDLHFLAETDGSGAEVIIVPNSAFACAESAGEVAVLAMNGAAVFNFATAKVPDMINAGLDELGWDPKQIDHLVLHQANALILKTIGRKVGVESDRVISVLDEFANTSCASIPLAITEGARDDLGRSVLCGFGVGLSWAALFADLGTVGRARCEFDD